MQPEQPGPIHHRPRNEPLLSVIKKRRLSLSNHAPKDKDKDNEGSGVKQQNNFIKRTSKYRKRERNSYGDTIEDNYLRIQMIRDQEKSKWSTNPKNILAFFPTYTTLVDNQAKELYVHKVNFPQGSPEKREKPQTEQTKDRQPVQRSKLAPIRKVSKKQSKGSLNLSFFNIQKLSLVPINPQTSPQHTRTKNSHTATIINNKRALIAPTHSFDQSKTLELNDKFEDGLQLDKQFPTAASKTLYNMKNQIVVLNVQRIKPFNQPFQRYYYFDFIWKIAYSNRLKVQFVQNLAKKYKVYIGPGNNSMLVKTFFKRRQSWWAITDRIEQANFVWTQIKVGNIFNSQKSCKTIHKTQSHSIQEQSPKKRNSLQYKRNIKILNERLTQNWLEYYDKNRDAEQKLSQNFAKRVKLLKTTNFRTLIHNPQSQQKQKLKVHNHLPRNYILGNKKALFATMKKYYECNKQQTFEYLPLTFHIQNGLDDKQYFKFLQYFYKKSKQSKQSQKSPQKIRNIWIVKPGEFTNRGNGITVCRNLEEIKSIVKHKKKLDNGNMRTYILQEYLDRPFLYYKRKFDIRHYMLITCVNGHIKGYWYQLGYIRTTSYEYSVKNSFSSVHLTNDAVQKLLPDYGKYQKGNKVSYDQFQKYLQKQYKGKYSFYQTIYPQMRKIAHDSMRASSLLIDQDRKQHNFEIFGFDFMIDCDFHPWLIEINTNPCLELSCPVLMDVIPDMVQNSLKIGVDSILPPPYSFTQKRPRFNTNILQQNKFELLYDSAVEQQNLRRMFSGGQEAKPKLNYNQLEKDQEEIYEDDGVDIDD